MDGWGGAESSPKSKDQTWPCKRTQLKEKTRRKSKKRRGLQSPDKAKQCSKIIYIYIYIKGKKPSWRRIIAASWQIRKKQAWGRGWKREKGFKTAQAENWSLPKKQVVREQHKSVRERDKKRGRENERERERERARERAVWNEEQERTEREEWKLTLTRLISSVCVWVRMSVCVSANRSRRNQKPRRYRRNGPSRSNASFNADLKSAAITQMFF